MLKLSLIIPVYNEERHIKACLDSIANQSVMPDEVIVVDNNCSDRTIDIAKRYNFVKVVSEEQQGRSYARNKGFNSAKGDILGRIDADTQLQENWTELVKKYFSSDDNLAGLTGLAFTPVIPKLQSLKSTLLCRTYYWYVHALFGTITTWGGNMAVRTNAWHQVSELVSTADTIIHEDQDISLWMAGKKMKIIQANDVLVTSTSQSFRYLPKVFKYSRMRAVTKKFHRKAGNLPAPKSVRIDIVKRILSFMFAVPVLIYGTIGMIIMFPLDFIEIKLRHNKSWFD